MNEKIKNNLSAPKQLEELYRENKTEFKKSFNQLYPEIKENIAAQIWNERLSYESKEISWGSKQELLIIIALSFLAGLIAKIPDFTGIEREYFYQRNIAFIILPMLTIYFAWKQATKTKQIITIITIFAASALYLNLLPNNPKSDTLILACMHLPAFLWTVVGFTFTGAEYQNPQKRIAFLRYNGDLVVMTTIILISGMLLSAITVGLFELIKIRIEEFYFRNIAIWGLVAAPIVATFLIQLNPQLVKNVSPVIAKVFTPLVLAMLVVYLIAMVYTGKDPFNDREFLIIFNALLVGVMAIILFSIAETSQSSSGWFNYLLLFALSIATIVINGIALSAIIFRISEWGITPNRLAVLGSNLLILGNLSMVSFRIFKAMKDNSEQTSIENCIANYLPIYSIWTLIVALVFPVLFQFK